MRRRRRRRWRWKRGKAETYEISGAFGLKLIGNETEMDKEKNGGGGGRGARIIVSPELVESLRS